MSKNVSKFRQNALRIFYLFLFLVFGSSIWPTIISPGGLWDPTEGVAFSFWAAFSLLAILGVRYPLKMLPLLMVQLVYKTIWLLAVGLQLWLAKALDPVAIELVWACSIGVLIDLIIIPWPYLLSNFVLKSKNVELLEERDSSTEMVD